MCCDWKSNEDDGAVANALDIIFQQIEKLAADKGLLLDLLFPSFAGAKQKVLASFGSENVQKLQEVASQYDPERIFQQLQNGGFLLRDI